MWCRRQPGEPSQEAQNARLRAEQAGERARGNWIEVRALSREMRALRERNRFADRIEQLIRGEA